MENSNSVCIEEKASEKQIKLLFVLIKQFGISEREERLNFVSGILGKRVDSFKDLSKTDASIVIDEIYHLRLCKGGVSCK